MRYTDVEKQSDANFRMLTGYKRETFKVMLEILREAEAAKKALGGRPAETPMDVGVLVIRTNRIPFTTRVANERRL